MGDARRIVIAAASAFVYRGGAVSSGSRARIQRIDARVLDLELTEPFGIAGGSQERAAIVIVGVALEDGSYGRGEAAPLPAYNGERVEDALRGVDAARAALLGSDATAWRQRALDIARATGCASARCALETAILDALARRSGVSLYAWFGGCAPAGLTSDVTIPIVPPAAARAAAERWWAHGFHSLKIKIGGGDDLERILAAHAGAPQASLLLDANAGLSVEQALALLDELERRGVTIALFEQPIAAGDWEGLARVGQRVRLALDESVVTARDAVTAVQRLGAPHVLNVKLMKSGVVDALDIVSVARSGGMSLMIGGMLESALAMSTSACFAAGLGGFEFVDLDTPLFMLSSPLQGGFAWSGDRIDVSVIERGHGVELGPDRDVSR
jgi:L-alanine-DL-glutamate epimerase-like enolase superfamily enzyme